MATLIPNTPIVNAGLLYVNGCYMNWLSTTTLSVTSGQCRDVTNTADIVLGATTTITSTTVGVNGVDVAAAVASSFYAVYVIGSSTDQKPGACLLSLSSTAPSLPFGYDMFRRVGYVLTDSSAHFLNFWQEGRNMFYDVGISVLSAGTSTTYANVALTTAVPPEATNVNLVVTYTANSATNVAHFLPYGSTATNGIVRFGYGVAAAQVGMAVVPAELNVAAPTIQYKVSASDSLSLLVAGYTDQL
jgi:hypothetical protein